MFERGGGQGMFVWGGGGRSSGGPGRLRPGGGAVAVGVQAGYGELRVECAVGGWPGGVGQGGVAVARGGAGWVR